MNQANAPTSQMNGLGRSDRSGQTNRFTTARPGMTPAIVIDRAIKTTSANILEKCGFKKRRI